MAKPKRDSAFPEMNVRAATGESKPSPEPTKDLPRTVNGQLDNAQIKQDVVTELKNSRQGRKSRCN